MRFKAVFAPSLALSLLATAACDQVRYLREGVGTDLGRADLAEATRLQDIYLGHICMQAGADPSCSDWTLMVQAGMNDIDLRCDSFLTWIDYRRRSDASWLKQINDTLVATTNILEATRVGPHPMAIVSAAFGLASDTFINSSARLLTVADHSTVQSVVLGAQKRYRESLLGKRIANRPAAIHALRNYLRICMPFTIETQINMTVTLFERGGAVAVAAAERSPLISTGTVATPAAPKPVIRSTQVLPPTPPVGEPILNATGDQERTIKMPEGKNMQRALCVSPTGDFGRSGSNAQMRRELRSFNMAILYPEPADAASDIVADSAQLRYLREAVRKFPSCDNAKFLNGFEVGLFSRFGFTDIRKQIAKALAANNLSATGIESSGAMDTPLRDAITRLRAKFNQGSGGLDRDLYDWILSFNLR